MKTSPASAPAPRKRVLAPAEITPLSEINNIQPPGDNCECSMCRTDRRICDGGRPCARCVTYGFQCRDVRKRGRPKKDQEDKSLTVSEHPLFSEWSIGGGNPKPASEAPRKKRRPSRSTGGSGSAAAVVSKSSRHTSAAPLRPGETLPTIMKKADNNTASPISNLPKSDANKSTPKDSSLLRLRTEEEQPLPSYNTNPAARNPAFTPSPFYPNTTPSYPYYPMPSSAPQQTQYTSQTRPSIYDKHTRLSEPTSETLEEQLQKYREQYRLLYSPSLIKHQQQQQLQQQQQQQEQQQQQQQQQETNYFPSYAATQAKQSLDPRNSASKPGYESLSEDQSGFPFMNCLQELLKTAPSDLRPSSVVMREEVVCIDSLQAPNSTGKANNELKSPDSLGKRKVDSFSDVSSHLGSYQASTGYQYSSPLYSPSHPLHYHHAQQQQPQQPQQYPPRPYYPSSSSSSFSAVFDDDEQSRSYVPFEERRSAWDFSSSPKIAPIADRRQASLPSFSSVGPIPSASSSNPNPSSTHSSSLLRLLAYDN